MTLNTVADHDSATRATRVDRARQLNSCVSGTIKEKFDTRILLFLLFQFARLLRACLFVLLLFRSELPDERDKQTNEGG